MRLSRKFWIILGTGVFIVLIAVLASTYFQQVGERRELDDKLTVAQEDHLPGLVTEKETLESQLGSARSALDNSAAKYPQELHSIEYGEYLFEIAARSNVTLASLSFPRPSGRQVGAASFSVVALSLPISGSLADIFEFIRVIRTDARFASTQVNSVSMGAGSATISVTLYAYRR